MPLTMIKKKEIFGWRSLAGGLHNDPKYCKFFGVTKTEKRYGILTELMDEFKEDVNFIDAFEQTFHFFTEKNELFSASYGDHVSYYKELMRNKDRFKYGSIQCTEGIYFFCVKGYEKAFENEFKDAIKNALEEKE